MEKSRFEKLVGKYNLGGSCESVLFKSDGKDLVVRSISDDKNVLCEVSGPSMGLEAGDFAVYETARLRSLLGVLGETLDVSVKKSGNRTTALEFSDKSTEVTFVLADVSVIPTVPDLKQLPPFNSLITMDEQFTNTFVKAKGALSDIETFTVVSDGKKATAQIILGYSSINTNRVTITVNTSEAVKLDPISFSAKYLREILVANKDAKTGVLEISSKGLARTKFSADNIDSTYYLVQIDTKE